MTSPQPGGYGRHHMAWSGTHEFEGQVIVVTGATSGIGRATGRAFGAAGERVFVADAVLFFASPRASFITGHVLSVSGGLTMAV